MDERKVILIDITKKVLYLILILLIMGFGLGIMLLRDKVGNAEWEYRIEYLYREDINLIKADSIDCIREFIDDIGRNKFTCIVGHKIK